MAITEKTIDIPTKKEVEEALDTLFSRVQQRGPETVARYIQPTDPDFPSLRIADYIFYEFEELTQLVKDFENILFQTKENVRTGKLRETDAQARILRLMLVTYLQVVEADFPLTLMWNLLRLLHGEGPCWAFRIQGKDGKTKTLQYPRQKLCELCKLSNDLELPIGGLLNCIYKNLLRNAIAHGQFAIRCDGQLLHLTKDYSPTSRNKPKEFFKNDKAVCTTYTFKAIACLHKITMDYWNTLHDRFVSLWHWTKVE
ncbi:MAG: hypothetical protein HYV36_05075 [Lentisphaerae bacterium]|nr:hypothetical protein [Lentisphaerota bacterium]